MISTNELSDTGIRASFHLNSPNSANIYVLSAELELVNMSGDILR